MTIDHVKPLSRGGTWDDLNLVPSCFKCNHEKGDLSLKDFRKTLPDKKVYGEQYVHWLTYKRKNNR
jgi:5-methylcytosine-specific restriction endonuclease McrA